MLLDSMTTAELQKQVSEFPQDSRDTPEYARLLNDFGVACQNSNYSEAEVYYKTALAIYEDKLGARHPNVGIVLFNLASLYRRMKRFDEAEQLFQISQRLPRGADALMQADRYDDKGLLETYGSEVRDLRTQVEAGSPEAKAELENTIRRLGPWYHNLNLSGCSTLPETTDYPASRLRLLDTVIPRDLSGKTVLDIGCNSGFFSIEMKKRGASRVIGIDIMPHVLAQARFVSQWFRTPIELHELSAYDVESLGLQFDIVLFVGVLYHLKHPLYALEKVAAVCRDTMFMMSMVRGSKGDFQPAADYPGDEVKIFDHPDFPRLYFIEKSLNGDQSNWWIATKSCLKAMARVSGFPIIEEIDHPEYLICRKRSQ